MNTQIRIGHFSPDAPSVNALVDGEIVLENVAFGDLSDYLEIDAGSHEIDVVPAAGGDSVIDATLDLDGDTDYTVLAIGELADIELLALVDRNRSVEDRTQLRFVHASPDAPAVDVRVVDGPTLFSDVEFGEASDYVGVDASTYDIDVIPSGADEPALSLWDVDLQAGETVTVFATGTLADDSLDAMLVSDYTVRDAKRVAKR